MYKRYSRVDFLMFNTLVPYPVYLAPILAKGGVTFSVYAANWFINRNCPITNEIISASLKSSSELSDTDNYSVLDVHDGRMKKLSRELDLPAYSNKTPKVLLYKNNGDFSRKLSNLPQVREAVARWKRGEVRDEKGNVKSKFNISVNGDLDTKRSLNGCTITGLQEHEDGTITGYIWDIWNFCSYN